MLPEWLDVDRLSATLVGGIASLTFAAIVAFRFIRRLALAALIALLLVGAALVLALQWSGLRNCRETCSCKVLGQTVQVPANPLCGPERIDLSNIELGHIDLSNIELGLMDLSRLPFSGRVPLGSRLPLGSTEFSYFDLS